MNHSVSKSARRLCARLLAVLMLLSLLLGMLPAGAVLSASAEDAEGSAEPAVDVEDLYPDAPEGEADDFYGFEVDEPFSDDAFSFSDDIASEPDDPSESGLSGPGEEQDDGSSAPGFGPGPATAAPAALVILPDTVTLDALERVTLSAEVYPQEAPQSVTWYCSDPSVAEVDALGVLTARARGTAVITAVADTPAADGFEVFGECLVSVRSDGTLTLRAEDLDSAHPYPNDENRFWAFLLPDAENLALRFDERTGLGFGDFLVLQYGENEQISWGPETVGELAGQTVAVPGNSVRIWLISDDDGDTDWGFRVTEVRAADADDALLEGQRFSDPLASEEDPLLSALALDDASGLPSSGAREVSAAASVTLSQAECELEALDTVTLTAVMTSNDAALLDLSWSVSDETAVRIVNSETVRDDAAGTVTGACTIEALKSGLTTVTATAVLLDGGTPAEDSSGSGQDAAASCTVTVTNDATVVTDWTQLESEHPYSRPVNHFWQYTDPSATSLTLTFDTQSALSLPSDTVIVTDGDKNQAGFTYIGNILAGQTVTVYGNTVRIYLRSGESDAGAWGFRVNNVYATQTDITYTVTYYANGGTDAPAPQEKAYGVPLTLTTDVPVRTHYTFLGWSTDRSSGKVSWYPGDEYDIDADLTLYAVWDRVSTFNSSNRGASAVPYYGAADTDETRTYPKTPINLERPDTIYDKEVLHIRTVEDLLEFAENCSLDTWSNRLPVVLDNDLSLSDVDFQPIPLFNGSFDGRGHSIFDLSLTDPLAPCGFFLEAGPDATVKNLSVSGVVTPRGDNDRTGGLVGLNRGLLQNCSFTGTVAGRTVTGGLVGCNEATGLITGCSCSAAVTGLSQTGGIAGVNYGTILSCDSGSYVNTESVDPSLRLDDIDTSSLLNFIHSLTNETVGITTDSGGICGANEGFIEACASSGPVGYSRLGYNVGGIAGRSSGYVSGCANSGPVSGRHDVGGIIGQAEPYIEVSEAGNLTSGLSYRMQALHQSINNAVHDAEVLSSDISGQLNDLSDFLVPVEQAFRNLSLSDPDSLYVLRDVLAEMVSGMSGELQSIAGSVDEGSGVLSQDFTAISNNMSAFTGSAMQTVALLQSASDDIIVDESALDTADLLVLGKTAACGNTGEVSGESNVGGIVGSMSIENELDPDLALTSSDMLLRTRYAYRSVVSRCTNYGEISAWYECVGGIVGRADIGYVNNCAAYGTVGMADGSYSGGIVGLSYGTVQSCVARCSLSGTKYVGGILGNGYTASGGDDRSSVVSSCYALVEIEDRPQFSGAISGGAEGEYIQNYFVPAGFAGLNKLSSEGKAEPILYSVFHSVVSLPEESKVFTLRFVVDGETVKEVRFEYGASFGRDVFPDVPMKDEAYAVWDRTDLTDLRFDTVVTATYRRSDTALGSEMLRENGRPVAYVIGQFQEGDVLELELLPVEADALDDFHSGWFRTAREQISSILHGAPDYSICTEVMEKLRLSFAEDGLDTHTVHYTAPDGRTEDYRLYRKTADGWERLPLSLFGSYYSFEIPGSSAELALVSTIQSWWILLYIIGGLLFLALLIWALTRLFRWLRTRPKKPKRERTRQLPRLSRKKLLILIAVLLAAVLAVVLVVQTGVLQSGFAGYRILRSFASEECDLQTDIVITSENGDIILSSTANRKNWDGTMITVADQYGIDLYIANGTLYLENGRAFRIVNNTLDTQALLRIVRNAVRHGQVTREQDGDLVRYSTDIDSDTFEEALQHLLTENFDAIFRGDKLRAELETRNGDPAALRFEGEGVADEGISFRFEASILIEPLSEDPEIPEAVLTAIASGDPGSELLTGDALVLFAAWLRNDRAESADATIDLRAECGILSLDDSYSYYRQKVSGTDIHCVSSRLFQVYFTDEASCTSDRRILTSAESRLMDTARLIPIMRDLFLRGSYSCESVGNSRVYTIVLDEKDIRELVEQVIPELQGISMSYSACTLTVTIRDGDLYSLELSCGGSVRIVTRDVDAGAEVIVRFRPGTDHIIPAAVQYTLLGDAA